MKTKTLVLGATGATGRHVVDQLLKRGRKVKLIVRSPHKLSDDWRHDDRVEVVSAEIARLTPSDMVRDLEDCGAAASCLGHLPTWKGMYGKPRRLVTDAVALVCRAVAMSKVEEPFKFVLMNTAGFRNADRNERISVGQKLVVGAMRLLLPPVSDNEQAAEYLRTEVGTTNPHLQWVVVRPDSLNSEEKVSEYETHPSPTRNAIFNPGTTSRINVGHFMAELLTDDALWQRWQGDMPVVYDRKTEQ